MLGGGGQPLRSLRGTAEVSRGAQRSPSTRDRGSPGGEPCAASAPSSSGPGHVAGASERDPRASRRLGCASGEERSLLVDFARQPRRLALNGRARAPSTPPASQRNRSRRIHRTPRRRARPFTRRRRGICRSRRKSPPFVQSPRSRSSARLACSGESTRHSFCEAARHSVCEVGTQCRAHLGSFGQRELAGDLSQLGRRGWTRRPILIPARDLVLEQPRVAARGVEDLTAIGREQSVTEPLRESGMRDDRVEDRLELGLGQ